MSGKEPVPAPTTPVHAGNCFDFLRVVAAWFVLYSHSHPLTGNPVPHPVVGLDIGNLAVAFFFAISGYLVCQSWSRDPDLLRFWIRRGLRILPGLLVALLFTAFVIGPGFTSRTLAEYLGTPTVWLYMPKALQFAYTPHLPGLFEHNPYPLETNGSLWTIRYELLMYACLALAGALLPRDKLKPACLGLLTAFAVGWCLHALGLWPPTRLPQSLSSETLCMLGVFFFGGSCMSLFGDRLRLSLPLAFLLLAASAMIASPTSAMLMLFIAIPYAVMTFAYRLPQALHALSGHDYSYGIYIYAFPIQQAISSVLPHVQQHRWLAMLLGTALTLVCAALSWHCIEKPSLAMKDRLIRRPRKARTVAP